MDCALFHTLRYVFESTFFICFKDESDGDDDLDTSYKPDIDSGNSTDSESSVESDLDIDFTAFLNKKKKPQRHLKTCSTPVKERLTTAVTMRSSEKLLKESQKLNKELEDCVDSYNLKSKLEKLKTIGQSKKTDPNASSKNHAAVSAVRKEIIVKSSNTVDKKRAWDKRNYCLYCEKPFAKVARHLEDIHSKEAAVMAIMALQKSKQDGKETANIKKKMRQQKFDDLRNKGNFNHNIEVLKEGYGELIVKRCPPGNVAYTEFLPCGHCLNFYSRKDLHRHVKKCPKRTSSSNCVPTRRVQSKARMLLPVHAGVSEDLRKIFERMRVDEVSTALRKDDVIIKYGNTLCRKHYNNDDQTYYISNKLRELGRLLIKMQLKKRDVTCMRDIVNPSLFPVIIEVVTDLCGWDVDTKTVEAPSLGIKLGQLLGKISSLLKGEAIINGNSNGRARADDFLALIELRWSDEIARISRTELETRKWNKPKILPLAEDLKNLKKHLAGVRKKALDDLEKDEDLKVWRALCTSTLASIILLNRRREGEASKLELAHLEKLSKSRPDKTIQDSLSSFEQKLCQFYKRVEIRGKRGRKVPMIVDKELEAAIKKIVELREAVGVNPNNKYVFAVPTLGSLQFFRGNDALRKHVRMCQLECPEAITSTKLRKHIATLSQLLNLKDRELEMLAAFLGHDIKVHREYYRLPEDTLQIAKCGKLLMLMDKGNINDFAGKTLDEIEIDTNIDG